MKNLCLALLLTTPAFASVDWKDPAVICPEQGVSHGRPCLDLSDVSNPNSDFPRSMPTDEIETWKRDFSADLKVCRGREVLRREAQNPGSFTPLQVQISFMHAGAGDGAKEKLQTLRSAAQRFDIPIHTLLGALTQESLLSDLGISPDGGNYSCGIGQLNVSEWCLGMNSLSPAERQRLGWPAISCDGSALASTMVKPFYDIAARRLDARPAYQITATDFTGITAEQVVRHLPSGTSALQAARFAALSSFIKHCQDFRLGIVFKAQNLRKMFDSYVPAKLREREVYQNGEAPSTACAEPYASRYYPLHTGWLLTLAMYNAGPSMVKLLEHYYQASAERLPVARPEDLIEGLYWGGEWRAATGRIHYTGTDGKERSQTWTKSCVVQRHVARVIQHVTRPGSVLATSLEESPCASGITVTRQNSSGRKD